MIMKKLILPLLIALFLVNNPIQVQTSLAESAPKSIESKTMDKRAVILQAYLARYNSPMTDQAQDFIDAADTYNMDWKLLPSIAGVESTFGKFIPGGYNAWGWGVYGNQAIYFESWREAMFTVSAGLRQNYMNKGLNDPYAINRMYSTSSRWGGNVTYFLNDLEKFQAQYEGEISKNPNLVSQTAGQSATLAYKQ